ncbi:DUF167 domain-containing protein [Thermodesulfobacterium hydrogeniphilum]|uniref:DUF167 domain-containing protein n=1 Tax=Thermodesulfobacterium hydrogeniphilum TaxID=161156 RepID=UPI0005704D3A|nr:DUF167 domain-containing protein [Thermodesulfobacterium hydrogeniphilum]
MILEIKVKPGARKDKIIVFKEPNFLEVSLKAKPENNKANESLCKFLSKILKVSKNEIKIVRGKTSKNKILKIEELSEKNFSEKIKTFLKGEK